MLSRSEDAVAILVALLCLLNQPQIILRVAEYQATALLSRPGPNNVSYNCNERCIFTDQSADKWAIP